MNDAVAEAIDEFIALGHLEGSEEVVIAARDSVGGAPPRLIAVTMFMLSEAEERKTIGTFETLRISEHQ